MKIVVTGSLGNIGKPLVEALTKNNQQVVVISRNSNRQNEIEEMGAKAAIGKLEDVEFLKETFKGADAAFLMVPPNIEEADTGEYYSKIGRNYKEAIESGGVKRVVVLSSYGAGIEKGTGFIIGAYFLENILNKLEGEVSLVILRPFYFYYNLFDYIPMIKEIGMIGSNYGGEDIIELVDCGAIAAVAAEELQCCSSSENRKIRYVLSDIRSANEIASVLGKAIGKPDLKWVTFSDEETLNALLAQGIPHRFAVDCVETGVALRTGLLSKEIDANTLERIGKVKIEDFAVDFAAKFNS